MMAAAAGVWVPSLSWNAFRTWVWPPGAFVSLSLSKALSSKLKRPLPLNPGSLRLGLRFSPQAEPCACTFDYFS